MSEDNPDRRSVLKGIAGAGALGLGASQLSVSAAAAGGTIEMLDGSDRLSLARTFSKTDAFQRLVRKARSLGYEVATSADRITAGVTNADGFNREVVSFGLDGVSGDSKGGIVFARDSDTDSLEIASLDIEHYRNDGLLSTGERYVLYKRGVETNGNEVTRETVDPNDAVVDEFVDRVEAAQRPSTDYDLPDLPDVFDVSECGGCYFAADKICKFLCGRLGAVACGLLGLSVVGGIGCWALTKAVCWVADYLSGCGDDVAATICKSTGLGVCPDSKPGDPITGEDIPYI